MRRSMLIATLIALAMFAGACGRLNDQGSGGGNGAGSGGIKHPTGAGDLILQVGVSGGFVAPSTTLTQMPGSSLYGDGTLVTQGPQIDIYPGPALPALIQTHVSEEGIQAILQAAHDAGLFGPDVSYGFNCIADVGTTSHPQRRGQHPHDRRLRARDLGGLVPWSRRGGPDEARAVRCQAR